jgi:hypothetical protein
MMDIRSSEATRQSDVGCEACACVDFFMHFVWSRENAPANPLRTSYYCTQRFVCGNSQ